MVWARCRRGAPRGRTRAGRGAGTVGAASGARGDRARVPRPGPDGHAASDPRRLGRTGRTSGAEAAVSRPLDASRASRPGPASSRATRPVGHRTGSRPRSGLANSARSRVGRDGCVSRHRAEDRPRGGASHRIADGPCAEPGPKTPPRPPWFVDSAGEASPSGPLPLVALSTAGLSPAAPSESFPGLLPRFCRSPLRSPPSPSLRLSLRLRRSAPSRDPRPRGSRQRSTTSPVRRSSARSTRRSSSGVPSLRTTVTSMRVGRSMR